MFDSVIRAKARQFFQQKGYSYVDASVLVKDTHRMTRELKKVLMGYMEHACKCKVTKCGEVVCDNAKKVIRHYSMCRSLNSCLLCIQVFKMSSKLHVRRCPTKYCDVPFCRIIKNISRQDNFQNFLEKAHALRMAEINERLIRQDLNRQDLAQVSQARYQEATQIRQPEASVARHQEAIQIRQPEASVATQPKRLINSQGDRVSHLLKSNSVKK